MVILLTFFVFLFLCNILKNSYTFSSQWENHGKKHFEIRTCFFGSVFSFRRFGKRNEFPFNRQSICVFRISPFSRNPSQSFICAFSSCFHVFFFSRPYADKRAKTIFLKKTFFSSAWKPCFFLFLAGAFLERFLLFHTASRPCHSAVFTWIFAKNRRKPHQYFHAPDFNTVNACFRILFHLVFFSHHAFFIERRRKKITRAQRR